MGLIIVLRPGLPDEPLSADKTTFLENKDATNLAPSCYAKTNVITNISAMNYVSQCGKVAFINPLDTHLLILFLVSIVSCG